MVNSGQSKGPMLMFIGLAILMIVIVVTYVIVQQRGSGLREGFEEEPHPAPKIESCNELMLPGVRDAAAIASANSLLSTKRLKVWDPIHSNKKSVADSNTLYCYVNHDETIEANDYVLAGKTCDTANPVFKDVPFIQDVFVDETGDRAYSAPFKKCVIKADKRKMTDDNVKTFWEGIGDKDCTNTTQYFVNMRDQLSNQLKKCEDENADLEMRNAAISNNIWGVQYPRINVLDNNIALCEQSRKDYQIQLDQAIRERNQWNDAYVTYDGWCQGQVAGWNTSNSECTAALVTACNNVSDLTSRINQKNQELIDLYNEFNILKRQYQDLSVLRDIEYASNVTLSNRLQTSITDYNDCMAKLLDCKSRLSACTACNDKLVPIRDSLKVEAYQLSNDYAACLAYNLSLNQMIKDLDVQIDNTSNNLYTICKPNALQCMNEYTGVLNSNDIKRAEIAELEKKLPCPIVEGVDATYKRMFDETNDNLNSASNALGKDWISYSNLSKQINNVLKDQASTCVPEVTTVRAHYISCPSDYNCQVCGGAEAKNVCTQMCTNRFGPDASWNGDWAVMHQVRGVCGCSYPTDDSDQIRAAKDTEAKFKALKGLNLSCMGGKYYTNRHTFVAFAPWEPVNQENKGVYAIYFDEFDFTSTKLFMNMDGTQEEGILIKGDTPVMYVFTPYSGLKVTYMGNGGIFEKTIRTGAYKDMQNRTAIYGYTNYSLLQLPGCTMIKKIAAIRIPAGQKAGANDLDLVQTISKPTPFAAKWGITNMTASVTYSQGGKPLMPPTTGGSTSGGGGGGGSGESKTDIYERFPYRDELLRAAALTNYYEGMTRQGVKSIVAKKTIPSWHFDLQYTEDQGDLSLTNAYTLTDLTTDEKNRLTNILMDLVQRPPKRVDNVIGEYEVGCLDAWDEYDREKAAADGMYETSITFDELTRLRPLVLPRFAEYEEKIRQSYQGKQIKVLRSRSDPNEFYAMDSKDVRETVRRWYSVMSSPYAWRCKNIKKKKIYKANFIQPPGTPYQGPPTPKWTFGKNNTHPSFKWASASNMNAIFGKDDNDPDWVKAFFAEKSTKVQEKKPEEKKPDPWVIIRVHELNRQLAECDTKKLTQSMPELESLKDCGNGGFRNETSSYILGPNTKATFYDKENYQGNSFSDVTGNQEKSVNIGFGAWNDKIQSIKIESA